METDTPDNSLQPDSLTKLLLSIQEQGKQTNNKLDVMDSNLQEIKRDNHVLKTDLKICKRKYDCLTEENRVLTERLPCWNDKMYKKHYTDAEKKLFLEILKGFSHIVENRKNDGSTMKAKEVAWGEIEETYNGSVHIAEQRSIKQLKKMWSNMKAQQRNALTQERQDVMATGNLDVPIKVAEVNPEIAAIVPDLMTTAPSLFSSNFSEDLINDRRNAVFDEEVISAETLKDVVTSNSAIDESEVSFHLNTSSPVSDVKKRRFQEDEIHQSQTSSPLSVKKRCVSKESMLDEEKLNVVHSAPNNKINKQKLEKHNTKKTERLWSLMQKEEELLSLKLEHQIRKQNFEMEHLKKIYELEIRKAEAEAQIAEMRLRQSME
ncbi:uncharacterized protein LOC122503659 [Leptopilina heterotoma]|uniref:uncharacterized protein LOC122503659 n=1 Tax=Leptopilina heterotoma TaxID=63436 RepID=UPI001CAA2507|nr:uncharacterized protein LOC122503659 [Leptopilina heterotoma]